MVVEPELVMCKAWSLCKCVTHKWFNVVSDMLISSLGTLLVEMTAYGANRNLMRGVYKGHRYYSVKAARKGSSPVLY